MRRKNVVSELNLMVAGNSGLGKTSFIRTLYGTLKLRTSPGGLRNKASVSNLGSAATTSASGSGDITPENRPTSPNNNQNGIGTKANGTKDSAGYATGTLQRTLNSFEALFEIEENHEKINLTLVDTPGFVGTDDVIDAHCDEILAYLEYQFDLTLAEERKVRRNPKATDNQIHACIYFIDQASHHQGLSDADIRILKRLGTRVNLIPVIARGDTLTRAQTKRLKQAILRDAAANQIQFFQFLSPKLAKRLLAQQQGGDLADNTSRRRHSRNGPGDDEEAEEGGEDEESDDEDDDDEDDWDPEVLEEKAHLQSLTPFTVIAQEEDGTDLRDEKGRRIQGREFPWGVLDCLNSQHCDLHGLRSALLSSHRQELKEITYGYFYEKYRTEKLLARTKSQHIAYQQQQQLQQQQRQKNGSNGGAAPTGSTLKNKESLLSVGSSNAIAGPWEE
ncbi:hypothetical protein BGZ97_001988 [Linnemannia gamsii]|uniref:Septin-type G domain-containing protein n=1 Tax=Linnemannia gamsii TaxID=64522 RepID=A0A9P6QZI5_9FUNG|nr:hypothetical protein BGZ97_001988 [Linnemannia gamsii]